MIGYGRPMTHRVAISELKTHCLRLVDQVARERRELIVTKRGKPIVRVVPLVDAGPDEARTRLRGTLIGGNRVEDFDTGLVWEAARH
jgi:prevent-host-death family protein